MFIDKARIYVEAGSGGDGMSSFRREKFVEKGGPNGGNGGRGGSVILRADNNLNTLIDFRFKRKFVAKRGDKGGISNMTGRRGEDVIIKVPLGTVVRDDATNIIVADLTEDGQEFVAAKGGRGGKGNACYATSTKRTPTFAEKGEPGTKGWLRLELKLLADVGLVGYPSVGKSSIISRVSAAKPEIAAYHFTTLTPVLGVVRLDAEQSFVLADIPGLIEGAADGVGLGHDFLRHVERTKLILHIVDAAAVEGRNPVEDFHKINAELRRYSEKIAARTQILVANKIDIPAAAENLPALEKLAAETGIKFFAISAVTHAGVDALIKYVGGWLDEHAKDFEPAAATDAVKIFDVEKSDDEVIIERNDAADFIVRNKNLEKIVAMTNFDNSEGLRRFQFIWRMKNLDAQLKARGIKEGMTVRIGDMEFEWHE